MYRGRPWTIRQYAGFASAEETNARFRYLLERGQTGLSIAFDLPTQLGLDSDDPRCRGRGGADRRRDRLARRHGGAVRRDPARRGLDLDDDQRAGGAAAAALRAGRREAGRGAGGAARHRPERHPQGVHRARELHLPAAAVDAAHDRPLRVLRRAGPALEHDLDLRLPHPRGGLDRGAGARVHGRERDRLLRGGRRGGPLAGRVRRAAVLLLQRAQRLLPGGGEVPRGAAAVGARDGRALRRDEPEGARAALPRADRRLDADRAAAREQHRPRRDPGALGGVRRRAVAAHELVRRGAGAAERARGGDRAPHAAGPRGRGGRDGDGRSARRLVLHRGADRRARGARVGADRARSTSSAARSRRSRRAGCRARSRPPRTAGRPRSSRASGRSSASTRSPSDGAGEPIELLRLDPEAERRQVERTRATCAPRATPPRPSARSRACARRHAGTENMLPPLREALAALCTVGELCTVLREEWGTYDRPRTT